VLNGKRWREKLVQKRPKTRKKKQQACLDHLPATVHRKPEQASQHSCSVLGQRLNITEASQRGAEPLTQGSKSEHTNSSVRDVLPHNANLLPGPAPHTQATRAPDSAQGLQKLCTQPFSLGASSHAPGSTSSQFGKIPQNTYIPQPLTAIRRGPRGGGFQDVPFQCQCKLGWH